MKIPAKPLAYKQVLEKFADSSFSQPILKAIARAKIEAAPGGEYYHWDILRHISPPEGLTPEAWWVAIKLARLQTRRFIPLRDSKDNQFSYTISNPVFKMLHEIDQSVGSQIAMTDSIANPQIKNRYLQSSLIEEAITSSQLEGAVATREQAKAMLRSGRKPIDEAEQMILGNYRAMQLVSECKDREMTPDLVLQIHRTIMAETTSPDASPSGLRAPEDKIAIYDERDNTLLYQSAAGSEIPDRMQALCDFANQSVAEKGFMHPVLRAILLHFWLAYDHPFTDGNGRTARALFYWYMLKQGYWLTEFISISSIMQKASEKYNRSFLYTETDDNDLTYFLFAQLKVIRRAIQGLHQYIERKKQEIRKTEQLLHAATALNHRQMALLTHALRNPGSRYTIESHRGSHGVTYQTARADLLALSGKGLLDQFREGKRFYFVAPGDLEGLLRVQVA